MRLRYLFVVMMLIFVIACGRQDEEVVNIPSEIEPLPDEIPFENGEVVEEDTAADTAETQDADALDADLDTDDADTSASENSCMAEGETCGGIDALICCPGLVCDYEAELAESGSTGICVVKAGTDNTIIMKNRQFSPMLIEVKAGDTVTFRNEDQWKHKFQIRNVFYDYIVTSPGEEWEYKFEKPGTYKIFDGIFPADKNDMTVVVTE